MSQSIEPVDVVVVTFNSAPTLGPCLQSVMADDAVGRVVVVDNGSSDRSLEIARLHGAEVVEAPTNGGFGSGCNLGVQATSAAFVLLLNPDAAVRPGTVAGLRAALSAHPTTAAVASNVIGASGSLEPVRRRFPSVWRAPLEPGVAARLDERWYARRGSHGGEVDWLSAACILVRRDAFAAVGGFDERYFLYSEETDLCARWRDAGWPVRFVPGFATHHEGAASTGALPGQGKVAWVDGYVRFARTHHAHPRLLRTGIAIGFIGRMVVWAVLRRPEQRRRYAAAARRALTMT